MQVSFPVNNNFEDNIIILCFVAGILAVVVIWYFYSRRLRRVFEPLLRAFSGKIVNLTWTPTISGNYQGRKFLLERIPGSENSPPYLRISLFGKFRFGLTVSRQNILSHWAAKTKLMQDVKTGDILFDENFFVRSKTPRQVQNYLSYESIKQTVRGIFVGGFDSLTITANKIVIKKPNYKELPDLACSSVAEVLDKLILLAKRL